MMNRGRIILLVWLFVLIPCRFFSQDKELDSLLRIVKTSTYDTLKVDVMNSLFLRYEYEDDSKAQEYLDNALELSKKSAYKKGEAMTYAYKGFFAEDKGNYPEALKYYFESLRIREKIKDKPGAADAYFYVGNVYYAQENYAEALKKFTSSLKIYEELGVKKSIAIAHNNIGGIYFHEKKYEEALHQYDLALKIRLALNDERGIAESHLSIGNVYSEQGNYSKALTKYLEAKEIMEKIGIKYLLAGVYSNIGIVYTRQKKFKDAAVFLNKAKQLALEIGFKECLSNTYDGLSELDSATGNYKGAFENHKLHVLYSDSLDNEETRKKTIQNQMTYDFEKKEAVALAEHQKELENQELIAEEKNRKQKSVLLLVSCFLILVVVFAGFIFRSLRITRKQKDIIENQKLLVEQQKYEVEEQKSRVEEHQKAIVDSITYARRIQESLLPTDKYIQKTINRLRKK